MYYLPQSAVSIASLVGAADELLEAAVFDFVEPEPCLLLRKV